MKALHQKFYFFIAVFTLSSCASFENLTDDRTRAEDDEMYWNGKELFYDNPSVASAAASGDDYYDPNSTNRANSFNGGTNPRASFNPISGWQLSYGLNAFSNYNNGFGMGLGYGSFNPYNSFGNNSFGYNPYGMNSFGYNPYSSFNPYGGYGFNPYGYGMGGLGWGGNGFGNGWIGNGNGNGWGGSVNNGEAVNVTNHHRRPTSVGTGNSSTYNRGVLQKNLVQPIVETPRAPKPITSVTTNGNYNVPSNTRGGTPQYTSPGSSPARSTTSPARSTPNYSSPTYASPSRSNPSKTTPTYRTPSRSTPTYSSPSHNSKPSRSTPAPSTPTHTSPSRSTPTRTTTPSHSSPSRSTSPSKRP